MKTVSALVVIFITLPIWFYLLHFILTATNAGPLEWFLYWAYVPFGLFATLTAKLVEKS